jgi:GT2 family glycosyltransferase
LKDLSVIIVNYRGGEKLKNCLESLHNIEDRRFTIEVVVVDNQSDDGSLPKLSLLFPQFVFVTNTGNNGFANGCNLGASHSKGDILLFLNPDTSVNADALYDMLEEVRIRPEYSIVSCSQVREDGKMDRPYGRFLTIFTATGWLRSIHRIFFGRMEDQFRQTPQCIYPDWVSGSVTMIRRDSFLDLGKWDDDFWMYFEDVDLCRRASHRNGEIVQLKNALIGHLHGGSSRSNLAVTVLTKTEVHISRHLYIAKHEKGLIELFMHLVLILDNLLLGLLPALLGFTFFFVKKLHLFSRIYLSLVGYYLRVCRSGRWLSSRSVNYRR